MEAMSFASVSSPIGRIGIWATDKGIAHLEIGAKATKPVSLSPAQEKHLEKALDELERYFQGKLKKFTVSTDTSGTEFQMDVWGEIDQIKFGDFLSYGEIAQKVGKPLAARAVGGAVGSNPVPIIIGCHRVMGSSGSVTGYSGGRGIKTKLWLLEHEGIPYKK